MDFYILVCLIKVIALDRGTFRNVAFNNYYTQNWRTVINCILYFVLSRFLQFAINICKFAAKQNLNVERGNCSRVFG